MSKLVIKDKTCYLEEDDRQRLWYIDRDLSYEVQGAAFTKAYQFGYKNAEGKFVSWDGRNRLLNESDLSFPIGLQQRVIDLYKGFGSELVVEDRREPKSVGMAISIGSRLREIGKVPRPYQIEILEAARKNDYGIVKASTGAGKTLAIALITADIGKKTIVYVIGKDLLYQFYFLFKDIFVDEKVGIIGDGYCEIGDINIVSIWTAGCALGLDEQDIIIDDEGDEKEKLQPDKYKQIKDLITSAKVIFFDENHLCSCNTIVEISKISNPEHIYGFSASPWRDDNSDIIIESILGKRIIDISASRLINDGFLVRPTINFIKTPKYHTKLKRNYKSIYKTYIVENKERNQLIVDYTIKLINLGYKPLILYKTIHHGEILNKLLRDKIKCVLLSGKDDMKVRQRAKKEIEDGGIEGIIASGIFDIGLDLPILSGLIIASSGKSSVRALQRIGRVIRPYKNKKNAAVVDFIDQEQYVIDHSTRRRDIYRMEDGFIVNWPNK